MMDSPYGGPEIGKDMAWLFRGDLLTRRTPLERQEGRDDPLDAAREPTWDARHR